MHHYDTDERTIGHVLADKAARIGDRPFLHHEGATYTYAQADELTRRYAAGFVALSVGPGDHVAVMLPNIPEFLWTLWGLGRIGAVAVPLNTAAKGDLLAYFLTQSDSTVVCVSSAWLDRFTDLLPRLAGIRDLVVHGAAPGVLDALATDRRVRPLEAFEQAAATIPQPFGPAAGDPSLILYTSGTTGPSKGVVSPHSQGLAVGQQLSTISGYRPDDVLYTCLPLFHGNALWYTVYAALWAEASVALFGHFSARRFWEQIRSSGATVFNCLGAMANILWQQPPGPGDRDHRLRICMMVPTSPSLAEGFEARFGTRVTSVFAMTENCAVTVLGPDAPRPKAASAGHVQDYMSVQVVDDHDRPLPTGEVGEICVRPNERGIMMLGYYKMGDATVDATRDLWFHTGDRGSLDADGYLFFSDRKKEAIRRRGENISAYEVETIICTHPAVLEAAAVPVASELGEDDLMVWVVPAPGTGVTFPDLIAFCAEHMAYFMVPRYLQWIDALPKTPSEKVEKYKLKLAAADTDGLWDREAAGITVARTGP